MWSAEPVHEPLIPKWMFDAINAVGTEKKGSRDGADANVHRLDEAQTTGTAAG